MSDEAYDHVDPYADGTYGTNSTPASTEYEADIHEDYRAQLDVVMDLARRAGYQGITGTDVRRITGWNDSPKSRALSTLLRTGLLIRLKERRDNAHIHVLPEYRAFREVLPYQSTNTKYRLAALEEARTVVAGSASYYEALLALDELIEAARS
jgi:hypothetical protein